MSMATTETMSAGADEGVQGVRDGARVPQPALLELLRRERADFLAYKRRVELERAVDREQARAAVLERLLPLLDELDRAFDHLPTTLEPHPWVQGVALSRRRLEEVLRDWGLERLGVVGERFDPTLHEAVAYEQRPVLDEPVIATVERAGFRLGPHLIRAARVSVVGPPRVG
jgi:molecular chaperone GrpE